jgi:alpha-soluble NSF attachment protein
MVCTRGRGSVGLFATAFNLFFLNFCVDRTANSCFKDAADLRAELEQYPEAIKLYESVASHSLASALTKYSVKEYWLKAVLCALALGVSCEPGLFSCRCTDLFLAQDTIMAKRNLATYSAKDTSFSSTREAKFANALIEAVVAGDTEGYTGAVAEFDQVTKLDDWKTSILLKIKRGIQEGPGLL